MIRAVLSRAVLSRAPLGRGQRTQLSLTVIRNRETT